MVVLSGLGFEAGKQTSSSQTEPDGAEGAMTGTARRGPFPLSSILVCIEHSTKLLSLTDARIVCARARLISLSSMAVILSRSFSNPCPLSQACPDSSLACVSPPVAHTYLPTYPRTPLSPLGLRVANSRCPTPSLPALPAACIPMPPGQLPPGPTPAVRRRPGSYLRPVSSLTQAYSSIPMPCPYSLISH